MPNNPNNPYNPNNPNNSNNPSNPNNANKDEEACARVLRDGKICNLCGDCEAAAVASGENVLG